MSKTFRRFNSKKGSGKYYYDDYEDEGSSTRANYTKKKIDRNIDNVIRSKNIVKLMELDDYAEDDDDIDLRR